MTSADTIRLRREIEDVTERYRAAGYFPSACVRVFSRSETLAAVCVGEAKEASLFDAASLTKIATGLQILRLVSNGALALDEEICDALPPLQDDVFLRARLKGVTLRRLLTHTSSLPAWYPFYTLQSRDFIAGLSFVLARTEGTQGTVYSDLNFMLLGKVLEWMQSLSDLMKKDSLRVIGLMSGTSADGMDAALTEISGFGLATKVKMLGFVSVPYSEEIRKEILRLASGRSGGSRDLCLFSFLLGQLSLDACRAVCEKAHVDPASVDLVGSHGQTLYHVPAAETYLGRPMRGTLQLGEASVIAEGLGCPVVSDFRVRDLAAGGQGAPLVPYTEYLLYRREDATVGLQNFGGIGNITVLPRSGRMEDTFAFDTGPGNMVMDQIVFRMTGGAMRYDENGALAASGTCSEALLAWMLQDPYLRKAPPKTTGREAYGAPYVDRLMEQGRALALSDRDILATACRFTAACVGVAIERHCPVKPDRLIVGGGGSRNPTLMAMLRRELSIPVLVNEDLGLDSDAKEAVAFAILANECVHGSANNMPSVTGAAHPVVMGKISL